MEEYLPLATAMEAYNKRFGNKQSITKSLNKCTRYKLSRFNFYLAYGRVSSHGADNNLFYSEIFKKFRIDFRIIFTNK